MKVDYPLRSGLVATHRVFSEASNVIPEHLETRVDLSIPIFPACPLGRAIVPLGQA